MHSQHDRELRKQANIAPRAAANAARLPRLIVAATAGIHCVSSHWSRAARN
jgi:hypothetical protein